MAEPKSHLKCFGKLECVFPMTASGLRETPEDCMTCEAKVACLKTAIAEGGGLKVEEEKVDRAYRAKKMTFVERWARRKSIHRRRQAKKIKK